MLSVAQVCPPEQGPDGWSFPRHLERSGSRLTPAKCIAKLPDTRAHLEADVEVSADGSAKRVVLVAVTGAVGCELSCLRALTLLYRPALKNGQRVAGTARMVCALGGGSLTMR
jgi:hypothetical protein